MKLARIGAPGAEVPAILDGNGKYRDLSRIVDDIAGETLTPAGLARISAVDPDTLPEVTGRIGPCVGRVGKFVAIGLNYADHAAETGAPIPAEPIVFMKTTSSICGPNDGIVIPRGSVKTDWEIELGIVIGKGGKHISEEHAMDHVAGFCTVNDVSEREWQIERGGTWDKGKGADTFGPIGPWMVTADEIADPQALQLWLEIDGQRVQNGSTATMIFGVKKIVSYLSGFMSLQPGDVITTGTPPGVGMGMKPQRYLKGGERIRCAVEGLGVQESPVTREA